MAKILGSRPSAESSNLSILTLSAMVAESGLKHSLGERKYGSTRGSNPLHGVTIFIPNLNS